MTNLELARMLREQALVAAQGHRIMLQQDRAADAEQLVRMYDDLVRRYEIESRASRVLGGVDWKLLRRQKLVLIEVAADKDNSKTAVEACDGILGILDAVQDAAAEIYGEAEVFGDNE